MRTKIIFIIALLTLWEITARLGLYPTYVFPAFSDVMTNLYEGLVKSSYFNDILVSLRRGVIGYSIGLVVGTLAGIALARYRMAKDTLGLVILGLIMLPSLAWMPLSLLWFGIGEEAIIFVAFIGSVFSVALAIEESIKNISPIYIKVGKTMGAKKFSLYFKVILPSILPSIISGIKLGWAFSWHALMAAEMLFATAGIGHVLMIGKEFNDMTQVVAAMVLMILIALIINFLVFAPIENNIKKKWGL